MKISSTPRPWPPAPLVLAGAILLGAVPGLALAEPAREPAPMYAGLLAGSAWSNNEIEDLEGFAHWGMPGYTLDYHDSGLVIGVLAGRRLAIANLPLRLEIDGMIGDMTARSNRLDPEGLDETVEVEYRWLATARSPTSIRSAASNPTWMRTTPSAITPPRWAGWPGPASKPAGQDPGTFALRACTWISGEARTT